MFFLFFLRLLPGFRAWPNRRCSEHYSEVRPAGGATIGSCLAACRAEERCAKTTLQPNASSPCYLFDAKSECSDAESSAGWATVFTGASQLGRVSCTTGTTQRRLPNPSLVWSTRFSYTCTRALLSCSSCTSANIASSLKTHITRLCAHCDEHGS